MAAACEPFETSVAATCNATLVNSHPSGQVVQAAASPSSIYYHSPGSDALLNLLIFTSAAHVHTEGSQNKEKKKRAAAAKVADGSSGGSYESSSGVKC